MVGLPTNATSIRWGCEPRLRVGYVSPDFNAHSVAYFFEPLLAAHDGDRIETYCYYCETKVDDATKRLIGLSDFWRDVAAHG